MHSEEDDSRRDGEVWSEGGAIMIVAVSVTKVFEAEQMSLGELEHQFQEQYDEESNTHSECPIDWYDIESQEEIWSFAILDEVPELFYLNLHYQCGSCGREFTWQEFASNKYLCPHCNWDSVRISPRI